MLKSWVRLEDESSGTRRTLLAEIREDWGRIARDFLKESATPERFAMKQPFSGKRWRPKISKITASYVCN